LSIRRHAGVVQAGDVRMPQRRQDVPLAREALGKSVDLAARRVTEQQLDCDLSRERTIDSVGQPHLGHAAEADVTDQPIGSDPAAFGPCGDPRRLEGRVDLRKLLEEGAAREMPAGREHPLQLREQSVPLLPQLRQPGRAIRFLEQVGLLVELRQLLPVDD
jgi:hypothetical protein